jgi:hypothetical protein
VREIGDDARMAELREHPCFARESLGHLGPAGMLEQLERDRAAVPPVCSSQAR